MLNLSYKFIFYSLEEKREMNNLECLKYIFKISRDKFSIALSLNLYDKDTNKKKILHL